MLPMMGLGRFRFALDTAAYQTLERQSEYRWAKQERLGRRSASHWIGEGEDTIDLDGVIYPHWRGGLGQLETLREMASAGIPYMLVSGLGRIYGRYTIERIREGQATFLPGGIPKRQEFGISLAMYGEDGGA